MKITQTREKIEKISVDAVVIPLFQGEKLPGEVGKFNKLVSGSLDEAIKLGDFKGKLYEVTSIYTHGKALSARVFLVGAGKKADFDGRAARNVIGAAVRRGIKLGIKKAAVYLSNRIKVEEAIEGATLANYDPGIHKTKKENGSALEELILIGKADNKEIKRASVIAEATNWVRNMVHEPGNIISPKELVEEAKRLSDTYKFDLEVIDEKEASKRGFGAFAGIAKGSDEPSFLVCLNYCGGGKDTLGLVGKGITFDTGGLSLKPGNKMLEMKADMAGAAVVFGVMKIIGELKPSINVVAVCPLTENMPSGKALKPGDVVTSFAGKTIEISNMDAEGRVVVADALTYAQKLGANRIIDTGTFTGAADIVLGSEAAAVMGRPQKWVDQLMEAGKIEGERLWQLPMYEEYKTVLRSDIADVANAYVGHPKAGTIAAAMFLQEFVGEGLPWIHFEIASTAWVDEERPYIAKGTTGFGVRTLVKLIEGI
ncbi:MAG: hypothetical protein A2172_01990 [Candidatus Woykebacteria bacterium RBG_13_40_15]|uniref:Probable cytosol aminopeptidase n=1 Tax=Candidatus Woykebacteria bacterium RBG_13_40_15 TaxID=1802593 RepID=A0A1G1W6B8_9BACT|nr:MAG: hypothetical protein A2172_01990 [Candidatus Woykebacteria bacterium RBG_13_40_15]